MTAEPIAEPIVEPSAAAPQFDQQQHLGLITAALQRQQAKAQRLMLFALLVLLLFGTLALEVIAWVAWVVGAIAYSYGLEVITAATGG